MAKANNRTQELFKAKLAARKKETEEKAMSRKSRKIFNMT